MKTNCFLKHLLTPVWSDERLVRVSHETSVITKQTTLIQTGEEHDSVGWMMCSTYCDPFFVKENTIFFLSSEIMLKKTRFHKVVGLRAVS